MKKMILPIALALVAAVGFVMWCCVYAGTRPDYHFDQEEEGDDLDVASLLDEELDPDYYPEDM